MKTTYNFLGSWQLLPERCVYTEGIAPKSMILKLENVNDQLQVDTTWLTYDNQSLFTSYTTPVNEAPTAFAHAEIADTIVCTCDGKFEMEIIAYKQDAIVWRTQLHITPKGLLQITISGVNSDGKEFSKQETYHRQLSVLPYAHSVSGVALVPNAEGSIKHKALQAMAEQTDMHLNQIRQQIELLAKQANEIQRRKELSMLVYDAKIGFKPQIGQVYHLYLKKDGSHTLSMVSPIEWGGGAGPYQEHLGGIKLLSDHTWTEIAEI
jgi:Protein of unknown function (DUF2452)